MSPDAQNAIMEALPDDAQKAINDVITMKDVEEDEEEKSANSGSSSRTSSSSNSAGQT
jgi:hypothetical protein